MTLTIEERAEAFARAFPKRPAAKPYVVLEQGQPVLYGRWLIGARYKNPSLFYGAYPAGYLPMVLALYPDVAAADILHVFSGSLGAGEYTRCDIRQQADISCSVYEVAAHASRKFPLILADPPYSVDDATRYQTPAINRSKAMRALADVAEPGAHLVWLDTVWPMHSKKQWRTCGRIALTRSTNHRLRDITIFERVAA